MENEHPLRTYRKHVDKSLDDLANECGTTRATLSRIENGLQNPSLALIERIREATFGAIRADDFLPFRPADIGGEGGAEAEKTSAADGLGGSSPAAPEMVRVAE